MTGVGIYLFDDVEVLDFAGPFEVFSTASRMKSRLQPGAAQGQPAAGKFLLKMVHAKIAGAP